METKQAQALAERWAQPHEVSVLEAAFSGVVSHLMPAYDEIPAEFQRHRGTLWNRVQMQWFYRGIDPAGFVPKPGIERDAALRHLKAIQGSFEPKHEHKEAAVAYLMSLWFEDYTGEVTVR